MKKLFIKNLFILYLAVPLYTPAFAQEELQIHQINVGDGQFRFFIGDDPGGQNCTYIDQEGPLTASPSTANRLFSGQKNDYGNCNAQRYGYVIRISGNHLATASTFQVYSDIAARRFTPY